MNEIVNSVHFLKQQKWVDLSHSIYGGILFFKVSTPVLAVDQNQRKESCRKSCYSLTVEDNFEDK